MRLWDLYRGRDYNIVPTLDRIRSAVSFLGDPQKRFPSILVGGTNGKGSTCAFLERILREHGFKTGWFISPHLVDERERWRINGKMIDEDLLGQYVKELRHVFERFELTYFEAAVLIAFRYFADSQVDVAVLEVGMGGRWDATKVCEPVAIGITNVQRDHTRWLGKDILRIAEEKLALRVKGVPFVLGSARFPLWPIDRCSDGEVFVAGIDFTYKGTVSPPKAVLDDFGFLDIYLDRVETGLIGRWQVDNAALATVLARLFTPLKENRLRLALSRTRWEGRMEVLRDKPLLVVDGSHNPDAIKRVMAEVDRLFPGVQIVFSGLAGKEWDLSLDVIRRFRDSIILVPLVHYRGESIRELERSARNKGFRHVKILNSASEVWSLDFDVLALGSLYLVGEIKAAGRFSVI